MPAKKCVLCEQKEKIINQGNTMCIPYIGDNDGILQILSRPEDREYIFSIYHCPSCGREFGIHHTEVDSEKCSFCNDGKSVSTDYGSPHKGKLMMENGKLAITKHRNISFDARCCPMCGRNVESKNSK